jgi:hypothetical protein
VVLFIKTITTTITKHFISMQVGIGYRRNHMSKKRYKIRAKKKEKIKGDKKSNKKGEKTIKC